jgi:hypothetical protein
VKNPRTDEREKTSPTAEELTAETLRRYVELAIEIERSVAAPSDLTRSETQRSVSEGLVDPSTFKTIG